MRVLLQRVKKAKVSSVKRLLGEIEKGFLILLGVAETDTDAEIEYLVEKIKNLRVFEDAAGKMNLSLLDIKGQTLIVSQFTLYADCRKGRRPSFDCAAAPDFANSMYKKFIQKFKDAGVNTQEGEFGADMDIELTNWGPVTIWLDTAEIKR